MKIYPAILENAREGVEEKVNLIKGLVDRVQVDIIDGLFADNLTVVPEDLGEIKWGKLGVDVHLMVDDPMEWVEACLSLPKVRVIGQVERMGSQTVFVDWVRGYKQIKGVGLALNKDTPVESLDKEVLSIVDVVVLLSVKAGYQSQDFGKKVIKKVEELRRIYKGEIVVDGGVNERKARELKQVGVDGVAIGSYLWQGKTREKLERLQKELR